LILVLEPDATRLSIAMFSLSINGYRVVGANTILEADAILKALKVDAVLMEKRMADFRDVPCLVAGDMALPEVRMQLRILLQKKRGPKKGTPSPRKKIVASIGEVSDTLQECK
jgi:CheY-like chemotaxis protein